VFCVGNKNPFLFTSFNSAANSQTMIQVPTTKVTLKNEDIREYEEAQNARQQNQNNIHNAGNANNSAVLDDTKQTRAADMKRRIGLNR